ncbi:MAG TPA: PAS domain S-box protein [Burkholderiaceae bacterium]|nr:PAS domain S-box protein [Burkholderiaceae bacterium]
MHREHAPVPSFSGFDERSVFRSIFSAHPDAMLLVDAQGRIVLSNPAAEALLGYGADRLTGMGVDDLVPDSIRPRHAAYRDAYGKSPRPRPMGTQMDLVARRGDGSEVMVEIALSPLQDQGLPFVVASIRDVGAYPRVRQALQRARYSDRLAQLGRLAVDERDARTLVDQACRLAVEALEVESAVVCELTQGGREFVIAGGYRQAAQQQAGCRLANDPDTLPGYLVAHPRPLPLPDYREERRFVIPDYLVEAGLVSGFAAPLVDRGRVFGTLTIHSRTATRFGEDETRFVESLCSLLATCLQRGRTEEALSHSQRLETVGQLTGGIAHDFNNLLTVIKGNLQIIEDSPEASTVGEIRPLVGAAGRATHRAAELTAKLLAFSRRQMLQPAAIDLPAMLRSLADMLRRTVDQRVRIEVDCPADCPAAFADPVQLESAMLNVAINARDAMPEGGRLMFRASVVDQLPAESGPAQEPARRGYIAIAISDTGTGMPEEVRERAFEPFFTTKDVGRGTGLGLSTVYGFVKQSRGTVTLASRPGMGTAVTLYIPQAQAAPDMAPDDAAADAAVPAGLSVLLVEDEAEVRKVARAFLAALDARVVECADAGEALAALDGERPFDLLLSDIALGPGLRGTELARIAQERRPELRVLLVSGFSSELLDADQTAPPDWALLPKPYSRTELVRAIATALRRDGEPGN